MLKPFTEAYLPDVLMFFPPHECHRKNFSNLTFFSPFLNGCSLFPSQQGQTHHQRWIGQLRRVQDEIGIASNMPMADDQRTRVVAKQHLLARQQRRVEVCGDGKRGSPQVVDAVRNVMKPIPTRRAEGGTTHRSSLGNGTGEQAHIDCAPKGRRSADPAQQSVFPRNARGRRREEPGRLCRRRLECMSSLAQQAWRQAHQLRETRSKRAGAAIAHLKANIGHAERSRHKQTPGRLKAQSSKKFARGNANQTTKDAMEMRGTHISHRGQVFEGQQFMQMGMHGLDRALNGLRISGKCHLTHSVLTENGCCCSHSVLPSPTELSSQIYSFPPDRKRQTNASLQERRGRPPSAGHPAWGAGNRLSGVGSSENRILLPLLHEICDFHCLLCLVETSSFLEKQASKETGGKRAVRRLHLL